MPSGATVPARIAFVKYLNADIHDVLDWRPALDLSESALDAGADLSAENP